MIDPVMLIIVGGGLISFVLFLAFFFSSREEDGFDRAFTGTTLALLQDQSKKDKKAGQKVKTAKKSEKKKDENASTSKDSEPVEEPSKPSPSVPTKNVEKPVEKPVEVKKPKEEKKPVEKKIEEKKSAEVDNNVQHHNAEKVTLVVEQKEKEVLKENVPKQEKKKPQKQVNLKDLDSKKVLARISNVENVEPEYVQFLTNFFRDSDLHKNNLTNEVKAVQRKLNESAQKVEKLNKEKANFETKQKEEQSKLIQLENRIQHLTKSEADFKRQLSTADAASRSHHTAYNNEIARCKSLLVEQQGEHEKLKATNQRLHSQLAAATVKVPDVELTNLKNQFGELEKVVSVVKSQLDEKNQQCEVLKSQVEKTNQLVASLEKEKVEWKKKEADSQNELRALEKNVEGMSKEIELFIEYKREQEQKEKENAAKFVEIPRNATPISEEEVVVLKKTNLDLATPSHSNDDYDKVVKEKERLEAKVEELRTRNTAILEKVEEAEKKSAKSSKNENNDVEGERKNVVQAIGKLTKKPFDKYNDSVAYSKWLQEAVTSVQSELSKPAVVETPQKKTFEKSEVQVTKTEKPKGNSTNSEDGSYYKGVLKSLLEEIQRIEQLSSKQAADYEATISALRQKC